MDKNTRSVLLFFADRYPVAQTYTDIEFGIKPRLSRPTIGKIVKRLDSEGLISRVGRGRSGATLSDKGLAIAGELAQKAR